MFCSVKSRNLFFSEDDSRPTLYSFANNRRSLTCTVLVIKDFLGDLAAILFVINKFISFCKICRVIAR